MTFLEDLDEHQLVLLKSALLVFRDCPHCQETYPNTHDKTIRYILPLVKKAATQRFDKLTSFENNIKWIEHAKEEGVI